MDKFETYQIARSLQSTPSCFKVLIDFYQQFKGVNNNKVFLDFSQIKFLDANMTAFLDAVIYRLNCDCGHEFYVDAQDIDTRFEIFRRNGFLSNGSGQYTSFGSMDSSIKLTRFSPVDDEAYYVYLDSQLFDHTAFRNIPKIKEDLINQFLEVFSNIHLHARTKDPVFACGQYYPSKGLLKFTLVDLGVGFLEPISNFTKNKVNEPEKAILWALDGNTTKTDHPGGLGLSSIKTYCEKNGHSFQIITDGYCWGNKLGSLPLRKLSHFPGTTITLEFNCK